MAAGLDVPVRADGVEMADVDIAGFDCTNGGQDGFDAEQVGNRTTAAVVQAIFLVIVLDAFFAVFFTWLGWN